MTIDRHNKERLQKVLRTAYFEKENDLIDDGWQGHAMERIRRLSVQISWYTGFGQMIWRLTPVVSTMIIVLFAILLNFDFFSDSAVYTYLTYEQDYLDLLDFFGI